MSPKRKVSGREFRARQQLQEAELRRRRIERERTRFLHRRRRRRIAVAAFIVAALVLLSHWAEHLGWVQVLSPAAQDVFIGYPTAFIFLIIGGILWGV